MCAKAAGSGDVDGLGGAQLSLSKKRCDRRPLIRDQNPPSLGAAEEKGFYSPDWLTFRQAPRLGGAIRRGERETTIVYADKHTPDPERERAAKEGDEPGFVPFLKRYAMFNALQCDGLREGPTRTRRRFQNARQSRARRRPSRRRAPISGSAATRHITSPRTTSSACRISRPSSSRSTTTEPASMSLATGQARGMASAFVCASLAIEPTVRHADYLGSWLEVLKEDLRAILNAASLASKAADFILAFDAGHLAPF